ncbi:MAG: starch synthase [Candidatus Aramenus sulfurataquae]|uniref:Starch synthase n=1 Tax=Candidatus Aramenus sulfurataquae TaxID=1326980 RepID=W7KJD0_9CREN|nr:MAG: starch synthase [Candidatus Aramenus sulfurataquae]
MKRIESLWLPEKVDKVWMFSFELQGIASMGGLGNAVFNLSKALVKRGIEVTVIMPSHGRHLNEYYRQKLKLQPLSLVAYGARRGMDGNYYGYRLGFEKGEIEGVNLLMVKGLDYETGKLMDSWGVYDYAMEKSALMSRAIESYISHLGFEDVPSLIHINDWHSVLPGVKAKLSFEERRIVVPVMFTIHLLNKVGAPWHYASEDWAGLENYGHYVWMVSRHVLYKTRDLWDKCEGKIERFGCYEADTIASVSKNYLSSEVLPFVGSFMENKGCVTYNGTDWKVEEVVNYAISLFGESERHKVREKLYKYLNSLKSVPEDFSTGSMLWNNRRRIGINDDWTYEGLGQGPLVLFTGRIVYQKGVDILLRAFRQVVDEIHNARLIVLGIPAGDYGLLQDLIDRTSELRDNVRLILGRLDFNVYKLFHYASSVFAIPSRWEPFGISAVEAMAVGTPVVATSVGGLSESVQDVRWSTEGTGFLVDEGSIDYLARAIKDSLYLSLADENNDPGYLTAVRLLKVNDTKYWSKVRQNAIRRVDSHFRWDKVADDALSCYEKTLLMAKYRAMSYM